MLSNTHFAMAVHVLTVLAYRAGKVVRSDDLASTVGTNSSFLRGLIGELRKAGLVETRLGKGGGTLLARPASSMTLRDVYRATESGPALRRHECDGRSTCVVAQNMPSILGDVNQRLESVIETELSSMTIQELLDSHVAT